MRVGTLSCRTVRRWAALLAVLAAAPVAAQVPVPAQGAYHAAFSEDGPDALEALAGKPLAIVMDYRGWHPDSTFDAAYYESVYQRGSMPHMTWEPWAGAGGQNNQRIIDGLYDAYLTTFAEAVRDWGRPLMIRMGHEMNGTWYPWSGPNNGGGTLDGFGDPAVPDGPERFVAAYRHVHALFEAAGADNVVWIWCPNNVSAPDAPWNQPEMYYPGDDVVDWVGIDGYNWGTAEYEWGISVWTSFLDLFHGVYNRLRVYGKPMMLGEFASAEVGGDKGLWIREAYGLIKAFFTEIKAVTWFHIDKETDWRVNSSAIALAGYRDAIADPYFLASVLPTGSEAAPGGEPGVTALLPVYPNPAVGRVHVPVQVARAGRYAVRVFDVLGREVGRVHEGPLGAGRHDLLWQPVRLPAGVYLVRIEDEQGTRQTRRFHLTR